jgi:hypothetical protein
MDVVPLRWTFSTPQHDHDLMNPGRPGWVAVVKVENPSAAYVSLRAEVLDTKRNKVEQTIPRAYALK